MDLKISQQFLFELCVNNNRDWFTANKKKYDAARDALLDVSKATIEAISQFDLSVKGIDPKETVFRIYRDTRFSNDKTPYKNNMGIYVAKGGRKSIYGGYYLHIEPEASFLAGGVWMPEPPVLQTIRTSIFENVDAFKKILNHSDFIETFGEISDEGRLKTAPKGFVKDWPDIDILKNKSFTIAHFITDEQLASEAFFETMVDVFRKMKPFNDFLNQAIDGQSVMVNY